MCLRQSPRALADGSLLSIQQNQGLFSLLGNRYGGDGRKTFALPDLRGRVPVGVGKDRQKCGQQLVQSYEQL
ncbi:MAG: tail fiber protein [Alphaproteobacteria bacterium]|nr:tail fiber protein [Alphaproteobacteria bacterium]MBL7099724.1 tail fiber protein [Alphaproteobacteria bacterium]